LAEPLVVEEAEVDRSCEARISELRGDLQASKEEATQSATPRLLRHGVAFRGDRFRRGLNSCL
jgi:hypothetical protein